MMTQPNLKIAFAKVITTVIIFEFAKAVAVSVFRIIEMKLQISDVC